MKRLDFLLIRSFVGPFVLTTLVVVFIFLMRFLMMYFDEIVGKEIELPIYGQLFGYFALMTIPIALPLSTLLASLMTFGNLGEHVELTAMKAAGIPLTRIIRPVAILAFGITLFAFWFSNSMAPWANLKGFSLLYDIKTAKISVNLTEGQFYNEIPGYSIKVSEKSADGKTLRNVLIYDHTKNTGSVNVTVADSGYMYTVDQNNFLVFELFHGINYVEQFDAAQGGGNRELQLLKNGFKYNKILFSLSSFGMKRTDENQFKYHELMKNITELDQQADSTRKEIRKTAENQVSILKNYASYQFKLPPKGDSTRKTIRPGAWIDSKWKETQKGYAQELTYENAHAQAQSIVSQLELGSTMRYNAQKLVARAEVEKWHKFTLSLSCFILFIIGASLGAIIKKGGFGMPVLLSISFFIFMYVLMQIGDKYAKEGVWMVEFGVWMPDVVLGLISLFLLQRATLDARLFELDFYLVWWEQWKRKKTRQSVQTT